MKNKHFTDMERKNLLSYYQGLEDKVAFVRRIAKLVKKSGITVSRWCLGDNATKDEQALEVLSKETGIPMDDLFNRDLD